VAWEDKIDKAYFRGQISHPSYTMPSPSQVKLIPRVRLMRLAKEHPRHFDVAFTGLDQASEGQVRQDIIQWATSNGVKFQIPEKFAETLPRFKYLVNLDGVVAAFRMATLIGAGSVVLMQESHTKEFFMGSLTPWVHYVPINYSLSDLVSKIELLKANQTLAQEIARNGKELWQRRLRRQDSWCYMWRTLRSIAALTSHNMTKSLHEERAAQHGRYPQRFEDFYGNMYHLSPQPQHTVTSH